MIGSCEVQFDAPFLAGDLKGLQAEEKSLVQSDVGYKAVHVEPHHQLLCDREGYCFPHGFVHGEAANMFYQDQVVLALPEE